MRREEIWRALVADALPFLALSITLRLFDRIDLLLFKVLGGTTAQAGLYGAAQSLGWALSIVSVAFPPLLLATLTRLYAAGETTGAARLAGQSLRLVGWLLPIAGLAAGAGTPLASWLFGPAFSGAGSLLGPLLLGGVAQVLMAVVIMTLTAAGHPNAFVRTGIAMVVLATVFGLFAIPIFGAMGAAAATSATGCLGAVERTVARSSPGWRAYPDRVVLTGRGGPARCRARLSCLPVAVAALRSARGRRAGGARGAGAVGRAGWP